MVVHPREGRNAIQPRKGSQPHGWISSGLCWGEEGESKGYIVYDYSYQLLEKAKREDQRVNQWLPGKKDMYGEIIH